MLLCCLVGKISWSHSAVSRAATQYAIFRSFFLLTVAKHGTEIAFRKSRLKTSLFHPTTQFKRAILPSRCQTRVFMFSIGLLLCTLSSYCLRCLRFVIALLTLIQVRHSITRVHNLLWILVIIRYNWNYIWCCIVTCCFLNYLVSIYVCALMTRNDLITECSISYYVIIVHWFSAWHLKINLVAI